MPWLAARVFVTAWAPWMSDTHYDSAWLAVPVKVVGGAECRLLLCASCSHIPYTLLP